MGRQRARALRTMSSGVVALEECTTEFEKMKIRSTYQYIVYKITADKKSIVIDTRGDKGASFDDFKNALPDGDCRYAVLDVEIETKSGTTTNKLIFVAWCAECPALLANAESVGA